MELNKDVLKSRLQSLITSYIADRDQAIADFNLVLTEREYRPEPQYNITTLLKSIMDRIVLANSAIIETQEMWSRMNTSNDSRIEENKEEIKKD